MSAESERQKRIESEVEKGYSVGEAVGRERAREAGYDPPPGILDKSGTRNDERPKKHVSFDPGPKPPEGRRFFVTDRP